MSKILLTIFLLVTIFLNGCLMKGKTYTLEDLQGEWLQKNYVQKLQKIKSPLKSEREIIDKAPQLCIITKKQDDTIVFTVGSNFHFADLVEAPIESLTALENSKYRLNFKNGNKLPQVIVAFVNDTEIILDIKNYNWYKPQRMVGHRSKNHNQLVNEAVLAGDYILEDGVTSSFSVDGWAILPGMDKKFQYTIFIDCAVQQHDWFRDETNKNIYVFEWKGDKLYIYKNGSDKYDEVIIPTGDPIILTKID